MNIAWISTEYSDFCIQILCAVLGKKIYVISNLAEDFLPSMAYLASLHWAIPIESVC